MKNRRCRSIRAVCDVNIMFADWFTLILPVLLYILIAVPVRAYVQDNAPSGDKVIAIVYGNNITEKEKDMLSGLIIRALLDQFAHDNGVEATDEEVDTFIARTDELQRRNKIKFEKDRLKLIEELKSASLDAKTRKEKEEHLKNIEFIIRTNKEIDERANEMDARWRPMKIRMARDTVAAWKINKALYQKYGGRLIFQQAGIEPLDAYRDFLREHKKKGSFRILDKKYEPIFWKYFMDDKMHTFYSKDDGVKLMDTPWWMIDNAPDE